MCWRMGQRRAPSSPWKGPSGELHRSEGAVGPDQVGVARGQAADDAPSSCDADLTREGGGACRPVVEVGQIRPTQEHRVIGPIRPDGAHEDHGAVGVHEHPVDAGRGLKDAERLALKGEGDVGDGAREGCVLGEDDVRGVGGADEGAGVVPGL